MALSSDDKEELVQTLTKVLDRRRSVDEVQHRLDHEWVQLKRKEEQDKSDRRRKLRQRIEENVLGWLIITFLFGAGVMAYQAFIGSVKKAVNGGG